MENENRKLVPLTLPEFKKRIEHLQEVYNHNCAALTEEFMRKTEELFNRLSDDDQLELRRSYGEFMNPKAAPLIIKPGGN